jgi:hypothetical protein
MRDCEQYLIQQEIPIFYSQTRFVKPNTRICFRFTKTKRRNLSVQFNKFKTVLSRTGILISTSEAFHYRSHATLLRMRRRKEMACDSPRLTDVDCALVFR